MKKKRAEQVLQTTVSLIWLKLKMPNCNINRNEKKRAEQVLQTTVSLIWFKLQMSDYNINRNEKKCGVISFMVCNQVHCLQPGSGYATRFRVCNQV